MLQQTLIRFLALRELGLDVILLEEVLAGAEGFGAGAGDDGGAEGGLGFEPGEEAVGFPAWGKGVSRWVRKGRGRGTNQWEA